MSLRSSHPLDDHVDDKEVLNRLVRMTEEPSASKRGTLSVKVSSLNRDVLNLYELIYT